MLRSTWRYASFDAVVIMIAILGKGVLLENCDIKPIFRLLPVLPDYFDLHGFYFEGAFYYEKTLSMGCSMSCTGFFVFISTSLDGNVIHYIDDFLFVSKASSDDCQSF